MSEMSTTPEPSSRPETSHSPAANPPQNRHPPQQTRYAGDGLDFRRPIMSSPPGTGSVIDLTNEPDTSPRRMADVVDLEEEGEGDDEDEEDIVILNNTGHPSSPEVEFVGSTTRPPDPTPLHPPLQPPPQPPLPQFGTSTGFGRSHLWQWLRGHPRFAGSAFSGGLAFGRQLPWPTRIFGPPPQEDTLFIGDDADGGIDLTVDLDVDLNPSGSRPEQRVPVDTYKPPSPPPEGFTRNAQEDDVVVCPNCDEELGMGDEIKQQIWAVKNCGHVRITISPMLSRVIAESSIPGLLRRMCQEPLVIESQKDPAKGKTFL